MAAQLPSMLILPGRDLILPGRRLQAQGNVTPPGAIGILPTPPPTGHQNSAAHSTSGAVVARNGQRRWDALVESPTQPVAQRRRRGEVGDHVRTALSAA